MAQILRFNAYHRVLHAIMAVTFIGLAATGIPLKYSEAPWAAWLMHILGGYQSAGLIHRICAAATFGYFIAHILYVVYDIAVVKRFRFNPRGPDSMVPWLKDLRDFRDNLLWFFGRGPRPQFDRFTYWEKFDYWGVFWGVGMIGVSGLFLWFPEFFGRFFPGWAFNVATVIHSDEALLAAGFIFTVHFFNTHLRPGKFPMDQVIVTGRLTLEELQHERPLEYQRLKAENKLDQILVQPQNSRVTGIGIVFSIMLILAGLFLLVLLILGQFFYH
jgi:cytochrome b subunit of formate dehydrogenase